MKKIISISACLLLSISNIFSAPGESRSSNQSFVDERFVFDPDGIDSTTAFLNIDSDDSSASAIDAAADEVIAFAKQYLGRPYRSGAKGPSAFDCSGFTSYVFRNFDINLNPSSKTQATQGERIDRSDIRPGDLLFFTGRRSNGGVGHVAIAIDVDDSGDITFIHAASHGGISINHLTDGYYQKRFLSARRVLN